MEDPELGIKYPEADLANGRKVILYPITFGRYRLGLVNQRNPMTFDEEW